jgi:hypothetical protein
MVLPYGCPRAAIVPPGTIRLPALKTAALAGGTMRPLVSHTDDRQEGRDRCQRDCDPELVGTHRCKQREGAHFAVDATGMAQPSETLEQHDS